ncbi:MULTISPECIES: C40 family peptidase [unclassified Actinomyces]|uniref:C40 family peptidase n=1 Tax=unclassified Actinomyces TaxID=2609248 RepID=UPI000D5A07B6|nr:MULTISPECIES: C40 family peptidase [unclassified Actinomyces]RAX19031.1 peptidoglycan endopeptidase [Actinomyces sp. Z3]RAX21291.1 peptidoglycan endopeptidase [Actinomyces sp. Z5]
MTTRTSARHRKAARPLTPMNSVAPVARRGFAVAASSGLALGMIASGASAANTNEAAQSAGSLETQGVGALAAEARTAVSTNEAVQVADSVSVPSDVETVDTPTAEAPVIEVEEEPEVEATEETEVAADVAATDATAADAAGTTEATADATQAAATAAPANASGSSVVSIAMQYTGMAYVYGSNNPANGGFDCSGLVQYVYGQVGISLPRTSYAQGASGTIVSAAAAQPGDIVYYGGHVGIYAGGGMMIDAGNPSVGVSYRAVYGSPQYVRVG